MNNIIAAMVFLSFSFLTWLTVVFAIIDRLKGERVLFANMKSAISIFGVSTVLAIVMTFVSFELVCVIQRTV